MKNSVHFDETDLALLEALHVNARAPWVSIGQAIGVDGVTAARRWQRIVEHRLAWTTVSTGNWAGQVTAVFTMRCNAGKADLAGAVLADLPQVTTLETVIGRHDIRCVVVVRDLTALNDLMSRHMAEIPGLISFESQLVGTVYRQGSSWRAGALTPTAEKSLTVASVDKRLHSPKRHEIDPALAELLIRDARTPLHNLAAELGVSESLVRRRINSLINTGLLVLRAEAAPHLVGLPYAATLWFSFAPSDLDEAAAMLSSFRETRWTVSTLAGAANLCCTFWFRDMEQLHAIEQKLEARFPSYAVVDRTMRLKAIKRTMHLLDDQGLSRKVMPWVPQNAA